MNEIQAPKELKDRIIRARIQLLMKQPFYGLIVVRLMMKATDSKEMPTIGTDGVNIWYNPDFLDVLNDEELIWTIAHQVLRVVYDHIERKGVREADTWDHSCEYAVNLDLQQANIGKMIRKEIIDVPFDEKYRDMSSYQIYEDLMKNPKKKDRHQKLSPSMKPASGNGDGEGSAGLGSDEYDGRGDDELIAGLLQAARTAGLENLPPRLRMLLNEFLEPKVSWRQLLHSDIKSLNKDEYTLQLPNRKSWDLGIYLPSTYGINRIVLAVAIDVSGSVSEPAIKDMLSEVKGITESFTDFELHVWLFDTQIHNPQTFTPFNIDELDSYKISGGGGTRLVVNWQYMEKNNIDAQRFIIFTDGYCGDDEYRKCEGMYETIFVIFDNQNYKAPFGLHIDYDATQ